MLVATVLQYAARDFQYGDQKTRRQRLLWRYRLALEQQVWSRLNILLEVCIEEVKQRHPVVEVALAPRR